MGSIVPVVCAVIERDDTVFAAKRNAKQTNAGLWEFPGGKVDSGETPSDALKRELFEELSITVTINRQLEPVYHQYPWISIQLIPFICKIETGIPFPHEHKEIQFVHKSELRHLKWAPADIKIVESYLTD